MQHLPMPVGRIGRWRIGATVALSVASINAFSEIDYRVKIDPVAKQVQVTIKFSGKAGPVSVQIPNWMPGHYTWDGYFKDIHDVTAHDSQGNPLTVSHPDPNTWTASPAHSGLVDFTYWVPTGAYKRFTRPDDDSFVEVAGPANYMYVVGRKEEPCRITFDLPTGWPAMVGLDAARARPNEFVAPNYDVLADNPLSTGQVIVDQYRVLGLPHYIVLEGKAKDSVDRARLLRYCKFVSESETDFFQGAPYSKYVWHFIVSPGYGGGNGLEHLSSTQIGLSSVMFRRSIGLLAHEYFHLWNVKRIRAKVLGPFDYQNLPKTGALWWLEGVTDYYGSLLPYRYGAYSQQQFLDILAGNYGAIESNPAHLELGPNQVSLNQTDPVALKSTGPGRSLSYYNLGWLCGLCLDIEIRAQSHGRHSLDNVIHRLYYECRDGKPGFKEDEIRRLCIKYGGPSLGPFYDRVVLSGGELPVPEELAKAGLSIAQVDRVSADPGFTFTPENSGELVVRAVSDAKLNALQPGDRILSANGNSPTVDEPENLLDSVSRLQANYKDGELWTLGIIRDGKSETVSFQPSVGRSRKIYVVTPNQSATKDSQHLQDDWLRVHDLWRE